MTRRGKGIQNLYKLCFATKARLRKLNKFLLLQATNEYGRVESQPRSFFASVLDVTSQLHAPRRFTSGKTDPCYPVNGEGGWVGPKPVWMLSEKIQFSCSTQRIETLFLGRPAGNHLDALQTITLNSLSTENSRHSP
jgi:hypothetical protein